MTKDFCSPLCQHIHRAPSSRLHAYSSPSSLSPATAAAWRDSCQHGSSSYSPRSAGHPSIQCPRDRSPRRQQNFFYLLRLDRYVLKYYCGMRQDAYRGQDRDRRVVCRICEPLPRLRQRRCSPRAWINGYAFRIADGGWRSRERGGHCMSSLRVDKRARSPDINSCESVTKVRCLYSNESVAKATCSISMQW